MRSPNSAERRNGKLLLALGLLCGTILLSGAKAVTDDLRHRPEHLQQVDETLQAWSRTLTQGTVVKQQGASAPAASARALLLVKSCSLSHQGRNRNPANGPR